MRPCPQAPGHSVTPCAARVQIPSRRGTDGRGFPDLAAFSNDVCIAESCAETGTSCSTPIVATAIATLNAARAAAGKSALGFVNPLLYANAAAFTDVTAGKGNGYPTATGWDPVSGLGVPQSAEQAVHWYQVAAEKGLPRAQSNLAGCYASGQSLSHLLSQWPSSSTQVELPALLIHRRRRRSTHSLTR